MYTHERNNMNTTINTNPADDGFDAARREGFRTDTAAQLSEWIYEIIESHDDFDGDIWVNLGTNAFTIRDNNSNETFIINVTKEFN